MYIYRSRKWALSDSFADRGDPFKNMCTVYPFHRMYYSQIWQTTITCLLTQQRIGNCMTATGSSHKIGINEYKSQQSYQL